MKKIIFAILPLKGGLEKRKYPVDGNSLIESDKPIYYAVNPAIASNLKKDDEVKVVLLETRAGDKAGTKNAQLFMDELNEINNTNSIGAKITYEIIPSDFLVSKKGLNDLYLKLIKNFETDIELSADITFGSKSLPLLIFTAMQFGEKFFDCSIGNVIYLKAEFKNNVLVEGTQLICDYTPLYMLNSFTNTIECSSGEKAIASVEALLKD